MRNKGKRIAFCICLSLCFTAFAVGGLCSKDITVKMYAVSPQTAIVKLIPSASSLSGEFTIAIAVSTQANSYGITGKVTYDNTRFDYVPKDVTGGLAGNVYTSGNSAVVADFVDLTASFSQKEFTLATLTFKVKSDAPVGEGTFSYTTLNYFDTLVRAVTVEPVNITVFVDRTAVPPVDVIQVEIDGVDLQRNGEVWSGSVSSQKTQIDTKDIRIYGLPDDVRIEFSPSGIIELEEGVEQSITVTVINGTEEEVYVISITRKASEPPDITDNPDGTSGNTIQELWIVLAAAIALLLGTLVFYFAKRGKRNE